MKSQGVTGELARYMVEARQQALRPEVVESARNRILDSIGAVVSGARLRAGEMATRYVRLQGGVPEASVLATDLKTSAVNAALANGMFGHADETDDFEPVTKAHPGCSVVPAALALAEREGSSGEEFLRAVVLRPTFGGRCCFLRLLVTASQPLLQHPAKLPGTTVRETTVAFVSKEPGDRERRGVFGCEAAHLHRRELDPVAARHAPAPVHAAPRGGSQACHRLRQQR